MSRLRLHCFCGSIAFHGFLLLLLVAGSGFVTTRPETDWETVPVLDFIPTRLVEEAIAGGGDPRGTPPAQQAAPPPVQPPVTAPTPPVRSEPPKIQQPAPQPEPVPPKPSKPTPAKPLLPEPDSVSETGTKKPPPKPQIEVSRKLVTRDPAADRQKAAEQARAEAAAESARQAERARELRSSQLNSTLSRLQSNLSGRSIIAVPYGPGGGGETYAGYGLFVKLVYERAWRPPIEVPDRAGVVTARVVIARNGRVVSSELVKKSGVAALDKSVLVALGRVTIIGRSFPEGASDDQKTFLIDFDLQAKRGMG